MPNPTGFLLELGLEEIGKCFKWFLCVLEVSWLWQGKACGRYHNRKSHCVGTSTALMGRKHFIRFSLFHLQFVTV